MSAAPAAILIVDDEIQNRRLLETLLEPEGYLTLSAATGEEALASVARHPPDLILLDIMMPGMDGHQVARALKADPVTASIPIVMLTAPIDRSARVAGLQSGTLRSSSSSHTRALPSEGALQSPRGERLPPETTLGLFGSAERLNWLTSKKR